MTTEPETTRPRLLFFRWTRPGQPGFLLQHLEEQLACLRLFFDVVLVDRDCDYDEECDRHQPDLVLFESGVYVGPRQVRNVHTHPEIPKIGFLNGDAFDPVRAVFVSDMAQWGVETFFTVSASMADYTPEIADRLFCWPNFVDPAVHRDHGLPKVVPIILTGSQARHYPWRNRVSRVLSQHYPVLTMPHFGWAESTGARRMSIGESYSRLIGSAALAPSCGSFTRDLVRKHLEIPAARTCLIAERTPVLEAAGYVDMVNCVFADADDVIDKVDHLLADPDELAAITDAGHRLVHGRHTAAHRRQIRDWYDLVSATGSTDGIVQEHPLAPLTRPAASARSTEPSARPSVGAGEAVDRELVRRGWAALERGRRDAAVRAFTGASNYQYMPEAEVGKAVARLLDGDAAGADATVVTLLDHNDRLYGPVDPDPVQWAVHVWALLCRGALDEASAAAAQHPGLRHPTLERVRAVVEQVTGVPPARVAAPVRASVSPLPASSWAEWLDTVRTTLVRNGQGEVAAGIARLADEPDPADRTDRTDPVPGAVRPVAAAPAPPARQPRRRQSVAVVRRGWGAVRAGLRERVRETARRWVSAAWLAALDDAVEREDLDRLVVVGRSRLDLHERSLRLAAARNPRMPEVVPVAAGEPTPVPDLATLVYLGPRSDLPEADAEDLAGTLAAARVVVVVGTLRPGAVRLVDELVDTGDFEIVDSATRRGGYIVLRHRLGHLHRATR
ncbi:glycosyltransferase [Nocardioides sp. CER19]|uniref:glycosyltransferase family protein n=1 Tax=Nocardioides sp. CER19 TaxID=3038538 RepID=UPI002449B2FE|nr:glycosyltransferase [Nocardioides sp. CER19]MDH2414820.1 glycosyltransferase [Nocardioides sp. CER19]